MADDPAIGGVLLYGGWDGGSCPLSNETWVYEAGAWVQEVLPGIPGRFGTGRWRPAGLPGPCCCSAGTPWWAPRPSPTRPGTSPPPWRHDRGGLIGDAPLTVHLSAVTTGVGPFVYAWIGGTAAPSTRPRNRDPHVSPRRRHYPSRSRSGTGSGRSPTTEVTSQSLSPLGARAHALPSAGVAPLHVMFEATGRRSCPVPVHLVVRGGTSTATGPSASFDYPRPGRVLPHVYGVDNDSHEVVSQLSVTVVQALNVSLLAPSAVAILSGTPVAFTTTPPGRTRSVHLRLELWRRLAALGLGERIAHLLRRTAPSAFRSRSRTSWTRR